MRIWVWIKSLVNLVWVSIKWLVEKIWKPTALLLILVAVWFGFLALVHRPPLSTTPALIMVWASAIVLILALYPNILERIKGFKIGDFEIELQDVVQSSATENFISITSLDFDSRYFLTQKGDLRNLRTILSKAILERDKSVLLVINLSGDLGEQRISIPMLFVYLFFIDIFSNSSILLFVSSNRRFDRVRSISEFRKNELIGLVSGKVFIRQLYQQFPNLISILLQSPNRNINNQNDFFDNEGFLRIPSRRYIENMYRSARTLMGDDNDDSEYLTIRKVNQWLGDYLNKQFVGSAISPDDLRTIKEILLKNDEYFFIMDGNNLQTIVVTCNLTNNLSKRVVDYLSKTN